MQPKIGLKHYYNAIKLIIKIKRVIFCNYKKAGTLTYYLVDANWLDK